MFPRDSRLRTPAPRLPLLLALLAAAAFVASCAGPSGPARSGDEAAVSVERDRAYAERSGGTLRADVYRPLRTGPEARPGVVVLHPGGWFSGDKRDVAGVARRLAAAGYVAVAPQYRLAPRHRFPAPIHDAKEAVRWMRAESARLGIDPARIAALGYSSGGHLAALLATSGPEDGLEGATAYPGVSSRVQALVAGGAPVDLAAMRPNPAVASLLGGSAEERPERAAWASPLSFVTSDDPPAFLYHGRLDFLVSGGQPRRFLAALAEAGVAGRLELSFLGHFTTWLFGGSQEKAAVAFLDRTFAESRALVAREALPEDPSS